MKMKAICIKEISPYCECPWCKVRGENEKGLDTSHREDEKVSKSEGISTTVGKEGT